MGSHAWTGRLGLGIWDMLGCDCRVECNVVQSG